MNRATRNAHKSRSHRRFGSLGSLATQTPTGHNLRLIELGLLREGRRKEIHFIETVSGLLRNFVSKRMKPLQYDTRYLAMGVLIFLAFMQDRNISCFSFAQSEQGKESSNSTYLSMICVDSTSFFHEPFHLIMQPISFQKQNYNTCKVSR